MTEENKITIDGVDYKEADLSDEVKQQNPNLRVTDAEIEERLKTQQAIRTAYAKAVTELLPKKH